MRVLLSIAMSFVLSGCALLDAYFMAKYDPGEHLLLNRISVYSVINKEYCGNINQMKFVVNELRVMSLELKNYSAHLPKNEPSSDMINSIDSMILEFHSRYNTNKDISKTYCELKLQTIHEIAITVQRATAKRPRS